VKGQTVTMRHGQPIPNMANCIFWQLPMWPVTDDEPHVHLPNSPSTTTFYW